MIKIFNRWETEGIKVEDVGLKRYINLRPVIVPKTSGRNIKVQFAKTKKPIVERLITRLMVPGHKSKKHRISSGHCCGKATNAYKIVEKAFMIIEQKTKANPLQVFVTAIENGAPREEINTIEYGGARYPQAVEMSPVRRIDFSLRIMTQGAYQKAFKSKRKIEETLADEIMLAYNLDQKSSAISKKLELERQADSAR
ncbi:MAG: 30S ribosomal protein S7 [Nanoarchaeota archaeon]|nr:30S ribosomal protein S7 [Nanoarchaeota archaeon]MCG2717871.1 30S ribosomal protein S7 [Nanoarchaeota archaeon]